MATRRSTLVALTAAAAVLLPTGGGYAAYRHDLSARDVLPAGAVVGDVDVGGRTLAAATRSVEKHLSATLDRPARLVVGSRTYTVTPRELGAGADVGTAVTTAFAVSRTGSWLQRSWQRLRGGSPPPSVDLAVGPVDDARVDAVVRRAVAEAAVAPVDAVVRPDRRGFLAFGRSRPGAALDPAAARAALLASLADGQPRTVRPAPVAPKVAAIPTALLVRAGENRLYVYRNGRVVRTFGVATGSPENPTPTGTWEVVARRYRPTWRNPGSDWARNMPARIGPGPDNPLGTRALNLDASGIRIHGTPAAGSIGWSVSHGCIRMRMPDVEALYPMVPMHTPVVIVQAGPHRVPGRAVSGGSAAAADGG